MTDSENKEQNQNQDNTETNSGNNAETTDSMNKENNEAAMTVCKQMVGATRYDLRGLQVEPAASYWNHCAMQYPRPVQLKELLDRTDTGGINNRDYFPSWIEMMNFIGQSAQDEIDELCELQQLRDEPNMIASGRKNRERCPLSFFLQIRPQPVGTVINTARGDAFPVIANGRELARYFESETPGLAHRLALDYMIRESGFSPPRQGWIWAGLDVAIHSALMAAWYYKWLSASPTNNVPVPPGGGGVPTFDPIPRPNTSFRPRPVEVAPNLDVLYDRVVNSTGSGDGPLRPRIPPFPPNSPGTPRHPAYPSGHSTYGGAGSEFLSFFFPDYKEELDKLADNTGMARMWAGIHYRSDHLAGLRLGRTVARIVIEQMQRSGIPIVPTSPPPLPPPPPPTEAQLKANAQSFIANCGKGKLDQKLPRICQQRETPPRKDKSKESLEKIESPERQAPVG